jgi:flagellar motor component MotA
MLVELFDRAFCPISPHIRYTTAMIFIHKTSLLIVVLSLLSACSLLQQHCCTTKRHASGTPACNTSPVDSKVDLLLKEANRLADKVKNGGMSRVAAADQLNVYRLRLVGANQVDDNCFAMYRYLAVQRDAGQLSQEESQAGWKCVCGSGSGAGPRCSPSRHNLFLPIFC